MLKFDFVSKLYIEKKNNRKSYVNTEWVPIFIYIKRTYFPKISIKFLTLQKGGKTITYPPKIPTKNQTRSTKNPEKGLLKNHLPPTKNITNVTLFYKNITKVTKSVTKRHLNCIIFLYNCNDRYKKFVISRRSEHDGYGV